MAGSKSSKRSSRLAARTPKPKDGGSGSEEEGDGDGKSTKNIESGEKEGGESLLFSGEEVESSDEDDTSYKLPSLSLPPAGTKPKARRAKMDRQRKQPPEISISSSGKKSDKKSSASKSKDQPKMKTLSSYFKPKPKEPAPALADVEGNDHAEEDGNTVDQQQEDTLFPKGSKRSRPTLEDPTSESKRSKMGTDEKNKSLQSDDTKSEPVDGKAKSGDGNIPRPVDGKKKSGDGSIPRPVDGKKQSGDGKIPWPSGGKEKSGDGNIPRPSDGKKKSGDGSIPRPVDGKKKSEDGNIPRPVDGKAKSGDGNIPRPVDGKKKSGDGNILRPVDGKKKSGDGNILRPVDGKKKSGDGNILRPSDGKKKSGDGSIPQPVDGKKKSGDGKIPQPSDGKKKSGDGSIPRPVDGKAKSGNGNIPQPVDGKEKSGDGNILRPVDGMKKSGDGSKRSRPTSEDSINESKRSKMGTDEMEKSLQSAEKSSPSEPAAGKAKSGDGDIPKPAKPADCKEKPRDDPPPKPLTSIIKDNPEKSEKGNAGAPILLRKVDANKDGKSDTKEITSGSLHTHSSSTSKVPELKGKAGESEGNTLSGVEKPEKKSPLSATEKSEGSPSSFSLKNGGTPAVPPIASAAKGSCGITKNASNKTIDKGGMPANQSITSDENDSKEGKGADTTCNVPAPAKENNSLGKIDEVSADKPLEVDFKGKRSQNDGKVSKRANDIDKFKRPLEVLTPKESTPVESKEALSSRAESSTATGKIREDNNGDSDSKVKEPNIGSINEKERVISPIKIEHDRPDNDGTPGNREDESLGLLSPGKSANSRDLEKIDTRSRVVSSESTQSPMETEPSPTTKIKLGDSYNASSQPSIEQGTSTDSTATTSIQCPQTKQKPQRAAPSVGQLKMALFLEASKAHRGNGPERIFAKYWETLDKYITMGSHHDTNRRMRSDLSASFAGIESTLKGFLKTRKMKRLHNKLVLAVMTEAMRTKIPARSSSHIPPQWQIKEVQPLPAQVDEADALAEVRYHWNADFGPNSGAWTVCGNEIALTKTDAGESNEINPQLVGSIKKGDLDKEEVLPSARLPGALEIEPMMRKHAANSGMTATENAIWMLVVAVREHSASLIKKVIANDKDFDEGFAPQCSAHFQTNLACGGVTGDVLKRAKTANNDKRAKSPKKKSGKKVINSTSLSHLLEDHHSAASRLTWMHSAISGDGGNASCYPGLDNANGIINASIERAASRRQKSAPRRQNVLPAAIASPSASKSKSTSSARRTTTNSKAQSGGRLRKPQPSPPTSMSLNLPKLAGQRTNHSIHPPDPPQSRMVPPSMPSQIMQPPNSVQMMNHSDHKKGAKPIEQQTAPIPSVEPLTKPGFPSITNGSLKPSPTKSSAPEPKAASPGPKSMRRGSKNLAAMMSRPTTQPKPSSDKETAVDEAKKANGASLDKKSATNEKGEAEEKKDSAKEKKDDTDETKPQASASAPARGRGFGVKNLARMRQRTSFTEGDK